MTKSRPTRDAPPDKGEQRPAPPRDGGDGEMCDDAVAARRRWRDVSSQRVAMAFGASDCVSLPGLILLSTAAGFGALAKDAGFSIGHTAFMMLTFYALPAQVVLVDQLARGGSVLAGAFSVLITAIRMLPMVVSIMPQLRAPRGHLWRQALAVHGIAVTGWLEGMRRLPVVPEAFKLSYFVGLSWGLVGVTVVGAMIGFVAAGSLPPLISAVLLFLTPIYFLLSMLASIRVFADALPVILGCCLGPVFFVLTPGFDLLLTGVVGGGLAFLVTRLFAAKSDGRVSGTPGGSGGLE